MDNKDSSISQRNGEENVIFDNNDFNQNILNDQTNSPTPAQSTPTQILVANEQGQVIMFLLIY
jgi:ABC-type microcin C transport system permease subunit YejE